MIQDTTQSSPVLLSPVYSNLSVDCKNCVWILYYKTGQRQNEKYDTDSSLNNNNKMVLSTLERLDLLHQHTDDSDRYDTANAQSQMIHKQVWKIQTVNDQWKSQTVNLQRGIRWQMFSHRWFTNRYSMKQQMLHDMSQTIHGEVWDGKCSVTDDSQTGIILGDSKCSMTVTDSSQTDMRKLVTYTRFTDRYITANI